MFARRREAESSVEERFLDCLGSGFWLFGFFLDDDEEEAVTCSGSSGSFFSRRGDFVGDFFIERGGVLLLPLLLVLPADVLLSLLLRGDCRFLALLLTEPFSATGVSGSDFLVFVIVQVL